MVKRQFPRPREVSELIGFKAPELNGRRRRLNAALTIYDLREVARRRTPRTAFDYTDGGAEAEVSLGRARQAFEDVEFHPSILRDVSKVDASTTVLGDRSALPFGIAPTGFTRLMQTEGETAGGGRYPFLPLNARHDLDRGREGRQPPGPQLVPAVRHASARDLLRPG
jgi:L-lactate dehydrogenase (cytochrome)